MATGAAAIGQDSGWRSSIARKAVRAHGGEIQIRNMPGKGCVFVIEVPLAAGDAPEPQPAV